MQSISQKDSSFFHHLGTRDARRHIPYLTRLAKEKFPGRDLSELTIYVDYWKIPPTYDVRLLENIEDDTPASAGSENAEARSEALVERARNGKMTVIQSQICNGDSSQIVMSVLPAGFWEPENGRWIGDGDSRSSAHDPEIYEGDAGFGSESDDDEEMSPNNPRVRQALDVINMWVIPVLQVSWYITDGR